MNYTDDMGPIADEPQETDGVNRGDAFINDTPIKGSVRTEDLVAELNAFLKEPRFDGDQCVILTMPVQMLKKAKEKINAAVLKVYEAHKSEYFRVFDVLIALESMVDATVIANIIDLDIKRMVATDRGIHITDQQMEDIATGKAPEGTTSFGDDIIVCPMCHGDGVVDDVQCSLCNGEGKVVRLKDIPADKPDDSIDEIDLDSVSDEELSELDDVVVEDL